MPVSLPAPTTQEALRNRIYNLAAGYYQRAEPGELKSSDYWVKLKAAVRKGITKHGYDLTGLDLEGNLTTVLGHVREQREGTAT